MKINKGVSLIVLVVTIIVMVIIAGAVIISLTDTNVIEQAENATTKYRVAQFEENLNIEKQQKLLAEYGTTEGVNISVRAVLDITEENEEEYVVNIATANSIPANIPAGTYYKLDEDRYATKTRENERELDLASRAIDRDNKVVTNTYVVNENFDVYYVINGTIASEPEIDDNKVSEILTSIFAGTKDEATIVSELKQALYIDDTKINSLWDLLIAYGYMAEDSGEENNTYMYFYTVDRLYLLVADNMQFSYTNKTDNEKLYQYAKKLEQIRGELITAFVDKSLSGIIEDLEKENSGLTLYEALEKYILDNCKSIKSTVFSTSEIEVTFEFGDGFLGSNYFKLEGNDGIVTNVLVSLGS